MCLALTPASSNVCVAIALWVFRNCTQSMDQARRQVFPFPADLAHERTAVMSVANVVKTLASSEAPGVTGYLAGAGAFGVVFVAAGTKMASYNLGMLWTFGSLQAPDDCIGWRATLAALRCRAYFLPTPKKRCSVHVAPCSSYSCFVTDSDLSLALSCASLAPPSQV